jgi:hypothetical protein
MTGGCFLIGKGDFETIPIQGWLKAGKNLAENERWVPAYSNGSKKWA